jgi:hypothetical protein
MKKYLGEGPGRCGSGGAYFYAVRGIIQHPKRSLPVPRHHEPGRHFRIANLDETADLISILKQLTRSKRVIVRWLII